MKKMLSLLLAVLMILSVCAVSYAEETETTGAIDYAYLMYADASWVNQNWGIESSDTVTVKSAEIYGEGDYTVGLEFATEAEGLAFTAVGILNGENTCKNYFIKINAIRVNGEEIDFKKGYTSSDDGVCTRMNIFNEWVAELPEDARSFDGITVDASPVIVDKEAFASVKSVEVDFTYSRKAVDTAYIMYADASWVNQNWGVESSDAVAVKTAQITGDGEYTVGLEFATPAEGLAFTALGIVAGENTFPGACIKITDMRVNGVSIVPVAAGYTSSDDGLCTRMNIFNEWVSALPEDARVADGELADANWITVSKDDFASVTSFEVDFTFETVKDAAYIMYADAAWAKQNWGAESADGVEVVSPVITGEGTYTTSINFSEPASGLAFTALGIVNGENTFGGYTIEINSIRVNGEEIAFTKGYTSSDDGVCTRMNIFNEWVTDVPAEARSFDGVTEDAAPIIVDKAAFEAVSSVEITFTYHYGQPVAKDENAPLTGEEAAALLANEMHAYIGFQGKDTYVFRNIWNDRYGLTDTETPYFNQITGWADTATWCADNGFVVESLEDASVNMGGEFTDAVINGEGTYTVAVKTGELGFGATESFNMLFVSTDIPSALVRDGYVAINNVTVKIGDSKTITMSHDYADVSGEYLLIKLLDSYNFSDEPFGYTVPGANTDIVISFTMTVNAAE